MKKRNIATSKTVLASLAGLITAIAGGYTGALPLEAAVQLGFSSAQVLFLRFGLDKYLPERDATPAREVEAP